MAIQLPNSLYQGGNVAFDSTPTVKYYQQIEAERRAKQDAIDDYMRGLRSKVTPAGMRTVDLPAFDKMRKDWQQFGVENRDQIARNPQARAQFESMAQDMISFAEESKAAEEEKKPFVGMLTDPTKRAKVRPEVFGLVSEHDKPLYNFDENGNLTRDYNRKRLDYTSPLFKDPEFDFQKRYTSWKGGMKPDVIVGIDTPKTDAQTGMVYFPKTERYNKESIAQIARNAARDISEDEDALLYYRDRLAGGIKLDEYQKLDDIHRKYFGTPIGKDKYAPAKLAAAEAAYSAEQEVRNLEPVSKADYEKRQADKVNNIILNKLPTASNVSEINDLYARIEEAVDSPKTSIWGRFGKKKDYTPLSDLTVDAQKVVLDYAKELSGLTGGEKGVAYLNNKDIVLKRIPNGGIGIYEGDNYLGELPKVGINIKVQPDVKAKRSVVNEGETRLPKDIKKTKMTVNNPLGLDL